MGKIEGVWTKPLEWHCDERGRLVEVLRNDDTGFEGFGQAYVTVTYPGVVKAWHMHKKQRDTFTCVRGDIQVALYDARGGKSNGEVMEFLMRAEDPFLLSIPPGVYHGWKCVSDTEAFVVNIPDRPYDHSNPDEYREPPDSERIPYRWALTPGLKHG